MSDIDYFSVIWYADYLGIGYVCDKKGWSVFSIFSSRSNAEMIWNDQIEPLDETTLKMRFIECGNEYEFILYAYPFQREKANFGFYRSLSSSETYNVFKRNFSGEAFLTFGTIGDGLKPDILNKAKLVSDVKFVKSIDVKENSIEWIAEVAQGPRRHNRNE